MLVARLYGKVYRVGEVVCTEDYSDVRTEDSMKEIEWEGLYGNGWKDEIVAEAYA